MAGTASISGVVSGMKTDEIIAKLMELAQAPVQRMQVRKAALTSQLTAWQVMNTRVLALKLKANTLANPSAFQAKTVTSSDTDILTATATASASAGTYFLKVSQLALAHQEISTGYDDIDTTTVGTGAISITVGSGTPTSITIDSSNNTLEGVRDAINKAESGVTASIINDGSGDPYKLVVTSNTSGTSGAVTIDAGTTTLDFSGTDLQPAQNASITLGSGAGAITVSKESNTVTDLIPGVTLNLQDYDATKTITLTVSNNTSGIKQNITDFVTQYNNLVDFFNTQSNYDAETNTAGTLFGDTYLRTIQSDLVSKMSNPVSGLSQSLQTLSQIGISLGMDGKLSINETELDAALTDNMASVKRIFATVGEASNTNVTYLSSTASTKSSSTSGYAINVTAMPTQAWVESGVAQLDVLECNENLTINGIDILVTASMTQDQVVDKINEYETQTGVTASKVEEYDGFHLKLTANAYGSSGHISAISHDFNGAYELSTGIGADLITETDPTGYWDTGTGASGTNIEGTINGEAATGSNGWTLTGNTGNANTEGLKVKVMATGIGSYGSIAFTRGVGGLVSDYAASITDLTTGLVTSAQTSIRNQIADFDDDIADLEERLAAQENRLIEQFSAMESALSKLQSQSTFLTGQIAQMQNNWN